MPAPVNRLKAALRGGEPLLGPWLNAASPVAAEIADAAGRIRAAGKAAGIIHYDAADYPRLLGLGFNFLGVGTDVSLMRTGFDATLARARAAVEG